MRVLGIDCGTEHTGYGLIDSDGRSHQMIAAGCHSHSPKRAPSEPAASPSPQQLREVIGAHTPDSAAVEEVFYAHNVKTALKLSHARGVVLLTIAEAGIPLGEYSPLEIKTSVVGYGRAEKQQVKLMVHSLLGLERRHRIRRRLRRHGGRHLPRHPRGVSALGLGQLDEPHDRLPCLLACLRCRFGRTPAVLLEIL